MKIEINEVSIWRKLFFLVIQKTFLSYEDDKGLADALYARMMGWDQ